MPSLLLSNIKISILITESINEVTDLFKQVYSMTYRHVRE